MGIKKILNGIPITIDPNEFDEIPGPNCMSFGFELGTLTRSIEAVGLINSPLVTMNQEGHMDIVSGYRRIMALKAMQCDRINCIDLSDSGLSALDTFLLNLYDNICVRRFNEVEKGMILNRLLLHMSRDEIEMHFMHLLGIKNRREIDILISIERLNETIKESIAYGSISTNAIGLLHDLDDISRSLILKSISDLRLNFNQQLKYIDYLIDIAIRENITIADIMDEDWFIKLIKQEDLNNPQKTRKVLKLLETRRFPFLTHSEEEFNKMIKSLKLPGGVSLKHPAFFEGEGLRLEIVFKDGWELKEKIDILAQKEGLNSIRYPWKEDL